MPQSLQCPKCSSAMVRGYVIDKGHGSAAVSSWVEGEPRKSFWFGLRLGGIKPVEIEVWRCRRCGFIESYAPID